MVVTYESEINLFKLQIPTFYSSFKTVLLYLSYVQKSVNMQVEVPEKIGVQREPEE